MPETANNEKGEYITMKRIANDVAVATVLYTISGLQSVKIIDYSTQYDCDYNKNGEVVYDGLVKDLYGYKMAKYTEAKVQGISIVDGTIVFDVFTKFEQYK